ncbi:ogr/Delta-like zinc finger family protein [Serratia marcescens]|uniref:ogr/Delta-like zinc finger family protein n=1 Tax=Serratia marcescens TaxID=615 RepID=UPI003D6DD896
MFPCNKCGAAAKELSSFLLENGRHRRFHQCKNIYCGHCFTTIEEMDKPDEMHDVAALNTIVNRLSPK